MGFELGPRRGRYLNVIDELTATGSALPPDEQQHFEYFDMVYRSLCALLYNYVPMSGHPGGSISSGRIVAGLLFDALAYDVSDPDRPDADLLSYAAGHKALGLYAMWALRNEVIRLGAPELLPADIKKQLRLEDLLGFRRNPLTDTPRFKEFNAKALDGHPTPATPFVRLATGASGVGMAASLGLAFGAMDIYGKDAGPRIHILEGEGGMTPGRVAESFAAAATAGLANAIVHVDWNQASIDSNRVCRDGETPGDYVQWNPLEFAVFHDWNVVEVPNGLDFDQVLTAQRLATSLANGQPTAIVYRTTKGWQYGITGRASHGAGHKLCSGGFYEALAPLLEIIDEELPACEDSARCNGGALKAEAENCFWQALQIIRRTLEQNEPMIQALAGRLREAKLRLDQLDWQPRADAPDLAAVYALAEKGDRETPPELVLEPGAKTTLRAELGRALGHYNRVSHGALLSAAADLLGSTSVNLAGQGFGEGFFHAQTNPASRLLALGGICEDAMSGILTGLSAYGRHLGVASSYGAFIAPLGHIAARLHAIGCQARREIAPEPAKPFILICAHAGLKTGEDGPPHADPQALQVLTENFPAGGLITLTPWEPGEIWPLLAAALARRPAVIAPFVTRPTETAPDRAARRLAPASAATEGVYRLRAARGDGDGVLVLQGSEVAYAFVEQALPLLEKEDLDLHVYYVASAELFAALPAARREEIFPEAHARRAMGITGFTLPTMYRWVRSDAGRAATLHPFAGGRFLGSGQAEMVLAEAGLDGAGQYAAIMKYFRR